MAELTPKERLQPSLLLRLTDDEPDKREEPREKRVLSLPKLRDSVIRDLIWLMNAVNLEPVHDLDNYPEVKRSVLNYGMPDLSGHPASSVDLRQMEQALKDAILTFEPRLIPETLVVMVEVDESAMDHNALTFRIEGEVWGKPVPLRVLLRTEIDLEIGEVTLKEQS